MVCQPQYLLCCDSNLTLPVSSDGNCEPLVGLGSWQFVLERLDSPERLEAMDTEPHVHRDRIALLSVVRGLEALEHPGHVRLVTTSRYVDRGMRFGLPNWREADYLWESFGALKPIRNADLWQRISSAMNYHEISCRMVSSNNELIESLLGGRRKVHESSHTPTRKAGRLVVQPVGSLPRKSVAPLSSEYIHQRSEESSVPALRTTSARVPLPAKRQWWDMASAWIETVNSPPAFAH